MAHGTATHSKRRQFGEKDTVNWKVCDNRGNPFVWSSDYNSPFYTSDDKQVGTRTEDFSGYADSGKYAKRANRVGIMAFAQRI